MTSTQACVMKRAPLTAAEAIDKARRLAEERGWRWVGAVRVSATRVAALFGPRTCEVLSNAGDRGENVRVVLEVDTGEILDAVFFAR